MNARKVFQTPYKWGPTCYYNEQDMVEMVAQLKELGEDWEDVDIEDCGQLELVKEFGDGRAAYEGIGRHGWITDGGNRNGRREVVVLRLQADGSYEYETSYDPKTDADELEELGIVE